MTSSAAMIAAIIILFILVTIAIVLSIIALVYATSNNKNVPFVTIQVNDSNGAIHKSYHITKPTYIYYNVGHNSTLTLSGKLGGMAIVRNDSLSANITLIEGEDDDNTTVFYIGNTITEQPVIPANNTAIIIWESSTRAQIVFNNQNVRRVR